MKAWWCILFVAGCGDSYFQPLDAPNPDVVPMMQVSPVIQVWAGTTPAALVSIRAFLSPINGILSGKTRMTATVRDKMYEMSTANEDRTTRTLVLSLATPLLDEEEVTVSVIVGDETAVSSIRMPPDFKIDSHTPFPWPPLTVTWSPTAADRFEWSSAVTGFANHPCNGPSIGGVIPDTGTFTTNEVSSASNGPYCGVSFGLTRSRTAPTASNAAPGSITAYRSHGL